jgi:uncharacterized membrane protein
MTLKMWELISIVLLTLVSGMYWGPWLALSRSLATFEPEIFLPIVDRMNRNMAPLMTVLIPIALLATIPVLFLSYGERRETFFLTLTGLVLFVVTLIVTVLVEVPIVTQIATWTVPTIPDNWQQLRDRWGVFHLARIVPSLVGLVLLLIGAIYY